MNTFGITTGITTYGDPCRECGFEWSTTLDDSACLIAGAPRRYANLLVGQDGMVRHQDLTWTAKAYVFHVADNIRIWAERLWGRATVGQEFIHPYDQDALAAVRGYEHMPLQTALWSLSHSVDAWIESLEAMPDSLVSFNYPGRGVQTLTDVVQTIAHDTVHHEWDIARSLASP